jgi:hypothetical protein
MTDLEPGQIGLFVLGRFIVLIVFAYLVFLIALLPPLRKVAQQNNAIRITLVLTLGFGVWMFVFRALIRLETETSIDSPPHGVVLDLWDDFDTMERLAVFRDEKTEEELILNDLDLQSISRELFLRYTRPPFLRHYCFTGHAIACRWADIDLANFGDKQEWIDFLIRLMIGMALGLMTGFMTWVRTESKKVLQAVEAG